MGVVSNSEQGQSSADPTDQEFVRAIERARERMVDLEASDEEHESAATEVADLMAERAKRRRSALKIATEADNVLCERCGGAKPPLAVGNVDFCSCGSLFSTQQRVLQASDPTGKACLAGAEMPDPSLASVYAAMREIASGERKRGLILFGEPGRGKTYATLALLRECLEDRRLAGYFNVADLVSRIQSTYSFSDAKESRHSIISNVLLHDPVILDDLGKERASEDVAMILYELIDGIYRRGRTLIICSNTPGPEFAARYDGAVQSRIMGLCEKMVVRGDDLRARAWDW